MIGSVPDLGPELSGSATKIAFSLFKLGLGLKNMDNRIIARSTLLTWTTAQLD